MPCLAISFFNGKDYDIPKSTWEAGEAAPLFISAGFTGETIARRRRLQALKKIKQPPRKWLELRDRSTLCSSSFPCMPMKSMAVQILAVSMSWRFHCVVVRGELGWRKLKYDRHSSALKFAGRLRGMGWERWPKIVGEALSRLQNNGTWVDYIRSLIARYKLQTCWEDDRWNEKVWKKEKGCCRAGRARRKAGLERRGGGKTGFGEL